MKQNGLLILLSMLILGASQPVHALFSRVSMPKLVGLATLVSGWFAKDDILYKTKPTKNEYGEQVVLQGYPHSLDPSLQMQERILKGGKHMWTYYVLQKTGILREPLKSLAQKVPYEKPYNTLDNRLETMMIPAGYIVYTEYPMKKQIMGKIYQFKLNGPFSSDDEKRLAAGHLLGTIFNHTAEKYIECNSVDKTPAEILKSFGFEENPDALGYIYQGK